MADEDSGLTGVGENGQASRLACRILVISGAVQAVGALLKALIDSGHEIEWSDTGHHALGRLGRWQPDLILLDQVLPDMDTRAFLAALDGIAAAAHVPVLLWVGVDRA